MKAICNLDVPVDSKAPKYSSPIEEVPQGKKLGARSRLRRKQSSKHTFESTTKASKSQSGHLKKETKSNSAMDTSPSHTSPPIPVVGEIHKEAQQAAGGPKSLEDTSEDRAYPLAQYWIPYLNNRLEDLSNILKDTRFAFFTPDSPTDESIIVSDESEKEEVEKVEQPPATSQDVLKDTFKELEHQKAAAEAEAASLKAKPSYLDINQLTTLLVTSLKLELTKLLASHDFASYLPTKLQELPSKVTELSEEIKELKQHVKDMELELPGDLNKIPSKLETFTSTISSLSSQEKLKTLDSLPGLLKKVTNTLNRFATLVENASRATTTGVPSADKATASPAEGDKDANTNLKNELVDLLGIDIVTQYYKKKLLYERYRKMGQLKSLKKSKLVTYSWLNGERIEYLEQTEKELHIDFNKSLQEQDPLDELNDLANKKRKRTGDSTDHSRERLLGSVPEPFSLSVDLNIKSPKLLKLK
ncbi:hypothetical protein Tco_0637761 [Tanacetum coccineum]